MRIVAACFTLAMATTAFGEDLNARFSIASVLPFADVADSAGDFETCETQWDELWRSHRVGDFYVTSTMTTRVDSVATYFLTYSSRVTATTSERIGWQLTSLDPAGPITSDVSITKAIWLGLCERPRDLLGVGTESISTLRGDLYTTFEVTQSIRDEFLNIERTNALPAARRGMPLVIRAESRTYRWGEFFESVRREVIHYELSDD